MAIVHYCFLFIKDKEALRNEWKLLPSALWTMVDCWSSPSISLLFIVLFFTLLPICKIFLALQVLSVRCQLSPCICQLIPSPGNPYAVKVNESVL